MRDGALQLTPQALDAMILGADALAQLIERTQAGEPAGDDTAPAIEALEALMADAAPVESPVKTAALPGEKVLYRIRFAPEPDLFRSANDPLLIIRELKTLGELSVRLDAGGLPPLAEMDPDSSYLGWSLSLRSDRSEAEIREVFEFVATDSLIEIALGEDDAEPDETPLASVASVASVETPAAAVGDTPPSPAPPPMPTVSRLPIRVDLDRVDTLVNMVGELVITHAVLAQHVGESRVEDEPTMRGVEALSGHMRELQESVMAIRMQPVRSVFARMPRLVRESARDLGKRVRLITVGEATEIDNTVVERLADPLTHMIRNAVDHGVEPPAERRAASKPEEATISLTAAHRSGRITIEVSDDGRGIDRDKVYRRAVERGLIDKGAALADDEILDLIFLPGFSTAEAVTDLSGRGVGMDVVRRNIGQIGGRVIIDSQPGVGTRFLISLPLTLAVMDGMIVSVGNERYVLPLGCILESIRPLPDQVSTIAGAELLVRFRDEYVPLLFLHRLFGVTGACDDPCKGLVVFVETDTGSVIGIVVDNLLGERQVVIKSMEENFRRIEGASAATILGDGQVALILEVNGIHGMYRAATRQPPAASAAPGAK